MARPRASRWPRSAASVTRPPAPRRRPWFRRAIRGPGHLRRLGHDLLRDQRPGWIGPDSEPGGLRGRSPNNPRAPPVVAVLTVRTHRYPQARVAIVVLSLWRAACGQPTPAPSTSSSSSPNAASPTPSGLAAGPSVLDQCDPAGLVPCEQQAAFLSIPIPDTGAALTWSSQWAAGRNRPIGLGRELARARRLVARCRPALPGGRPRAHRRRRVVAVRDGRQARHRAAWPCRPTTARSPTCSTARAATCARSTASWATPSS